MSTVNLVKIFLVIDLHMEHLNRIAKEAVAYLSCSFVIEKGRKYKRFPSPENVLLAKDRNDIVKWF